MAIGFGGGPPPSNSVEVNKLVKEVKLEESTANIKIERIIVESIDAVKHLDYFDFNNNDYQLFGYDLVKSKPSTQLENGYIIETQKIYDVCSECKSETLYDEKNGEHYCPVCYTEDKNFLHKILKAVR